MHPGHIVVPQRHDQRALIRRLAGPVGTAVLAVGACSYLAAVDPNESGRYPVCPSQALLGIDCPGCGGMRGMYCLMHGDLAGAMNHNLLLLAILPIAVTLWVIWLVRAIRGSYPEVTQQQYKSRNRMLIGGLVVLLAFGVIRNFVPYLGSGI